MVIICGILLPFLGTSIGASLVFFIKNTINDTVEKILYGFSAGIMLAASIWSLLLPGIELSKEYYSIYFFPAAIGLFLGIIGLYLLKIIASKFTSKAEKEEESFKKRTMVVSAITLHNIPEGMAIGVIFASLLSNLENITLLMAISLSLGVAIQNIPEGTIASLPSLIEKKSKMRSFLVGVLSGSVEPIAALITMILASYLLPILPYLLCFAAGAMIFVVVDELIPEAYKTNNSLAFLLPFSFGFILMMALDILLV